MREGRGTEEGRWAGNRHGPGKTTRPHQRRLVVAAMLASTLLGGRAGVAQEPGEPGPEPVVTSDSVTAFSVALTVTVPGSPEAVYDALTGDISGWWDHRYSEDPLRFVLEPRPGGRFLEIFDESGDGVLHATVIYARRGERITYEGPLGFNGQAVQLVTSYKLEPAGDSTRLTVTANAAGTLDARELDALRRVWPHFILERFLPYWEERYAADG